jgi:hypothetical protein
MGIIKRKTMMWHDEKIVSTFTISLKDTAKVKVNLTQWEHGGYSYEVVKFSSGWVYIQSENMEQAKETCLKDLAKHMRMLADKLEEYQPNNLTKEDQHV